MKSMLPGLLVAPLLLWGCRAPAVAVAPARSHVPGDQALPAPKLAVLVVFDQLPQWALEAHGARLHPTGFLRGMTGESTAEVGAYPYAATMTAVGHATIATGQWPAVHGIHANNDYDDASGQEQRIFGKPGGPGRLRVATVFDEGKARGVIGRVIALSLKDRGAIALGGRRADVVIWHDHKAHAWATSEAYGGAVPAWARAVPATFGILGAAAADHAAEISRDVASARALFDLADAAIAAARLGQGPQPDVLTISVSSLDFAGHAEGVESSRYVEVLRAADQRLAEFVRGLATRHGFAPGEVALVLTSDHGSAPSPELRARPQLALAWPDGPLPPRHDAKVVEAPRGRFDEDAVAAALQAAATARLGPGHWVAAAIPPYFYLGREAEALAPEARQELIAFLLARLRATHGVWRAYEVNAAGVVLPGAASPVKARAVDAVDRLVVQGVAPGLGADLYAVLSPFWVYSAGASQGTHHGTPWRYDREVPVIAWPRQAAPPQPAAAPVSMTDVSARLRLGR